MTLKGVWKLVSQPKQFLKDYAKKSRKSKQKIKFLIERAINLNVPFSIYYYGLYLQLNNQKAFYLAEKALEKAIYKRPSSFYYYKFANILQRKNQWWRVVESYEKAIEMDSRVTLEHYLQYVAALEKMVRFEKICQILKPLAKDNKLNAEGYFKYGVALEKIEEFTLSEEAFTKAIEEDTDYNSQVLGVGIFYEKKGLWIDASKAYEKSLKRDNSNALLQYKFGLALERCYEWEKAEEAYSRAIGLNCHESYWHYKLGFVQERQEKYKKAVESYRDALSRSNSHMSNWYYRLGCVLVKLNKYEEASKAFLEQKIMQDAHGVVEAPFNKDKVLHNLVTYTEYYERYEIEENIILYESYHGRSISCNPYALFKEIYSDERFKDYKHVWAINDFTIIPENLKCNINIIFVKRESDLYLRYLTKAKYLINNTSFSDYFIRKDGQIYLNTWHGTPLKLMGKDAKDEFLSHKNIARNFLQTTHLIHPNKYTLEIMLESYDIENIYGGSISKIGYPRQDLMLNITEKERQNILNSMNIDKNKKVVLYAPTWRGTGISDIDFDLDKLVEDLNILTKLDDVHILYRGHYMAEQFIQKVPTLQDMIVPSSIDTNSLLSTVDILITDYSSIAFDFMSMKKPIIYYVYDKDKYEKERGLKFDIAEISENLCKNNQELFDLLKKLIINPKLDKKQINATNVFSPYDDGYASKRVVDLLFFNKIDKKYQVEINKKESILFYGGPFIPNGITTSLLNLISNIDQDIFDISIVVEPNQIITDRQRTEQFFRLDKSVNILARFGRMNVTLEEKWIIDKFNSQRELSSLEMWNILYRAYKREFLRVFGHTKFSHIINFEGYNSYWLRLFSQVNEASNHIYLHNEMLGEAETRFPALYGNFQLYHKYDNLVSVSTDVDSINKINLGESYRLSLDKFKQCDNLLNPQEVITKSNEDLESDEDEKLFNKKGKVFINMARLSPEKDQEKLIYAFAKIVKKYSDSKLIILGQGPLEGTLKSLVKKLAMQKHIFILGQRFNPMPYLKRMDCFVLSSNYEGQGLVLLEAMILGKPVISTDIVGPRSVLKDGLGLLVENSEDALVQGMLDFLEGIYKVDKKFDYEEYNQNAMDMFYKIVLNKEEYDAN